MNILFLTIGRMESIEAHSIYADLLRCFRNNGHEVFAVSPNEKRTNKETELIEERGAHLLRVKTGNVTETSNLIEKGIGQLSIERQFIKTINDYFSDIHFDLVLYSTPPITFVNVVDYIKKRDGSHTYLLLKDIFPQNAVDMGMMTRKGIKSIIYKYFRRKEKKLYNVSDHIGCMSIANVNYIINHNSEVDPAKVEVSPNAVEPVDNSVDNETRKKIREKYDIPIDKTIFVYGGNLGKLQGISFLIDCLRVQHIDQAYFLIVGDGSEYEKIETFIIEEKPTNVKLMKRLPKNDYDKMVGACDVGMIFLDHRFTIPNFPSRLLAYMQAKIPVFACTDSNTDIGQVIIEGEFGWWCESSDVNTVVNRFETINKEVAGLICRDYGINGWNYLNKYYTVEKQYSEIIKHIHK